MYNIQIKIHDNNTSIVWYTFSCKYSHIKLCFIKRHREKMCLPTRWRMSSDRGAADTDVVPVKELEQDGQTSTEGLYASKWSCVLCAKELLAWNKCS